MYFNFLSDQRIARCSPAVWQVGLVITPGYPQEGYHLRKKIRKPAEEVVTYNRYYRCWSKMGKVVSL